MSKPLKVLIIEDSEDDALLLVCELRREDYEPLYLRVDRAPAMKNALEKSNWDLILCDFTMPNFDGMAALATLKESGLDIPFIIVSGSIGEDIAVACMKAGASDYIMKNNLARLVPAVARELREAYERKARQEAEKKLRDAERLRMVGELASSIIHDLKSPMQVILGNLEFIQAEGMLTGACQKYCQIVEKQVQRMLGMCQEILDFARGDLTLTLEPVDLLGLCRELVETYEKPLADANIQISFAEPKNKGGVAVVPGDRERIWRVLVNLIGNAREAMPNGGQIRVAAAVGAREAQVEVADTGPGIPEGVRERVFEPFVTHGKSGGTGLGLCIVKQIVEAHKGEINFSTREGTGTTFRMVLPIQNSPRLSGERRRDSAGQRGSL